MPHPFENWTPLNIEVRDFASAYDLHAQLGKGIEQSVWLLRALHNFIPGSKSRNAAESIARRLRVYWRAPCLHCKKGRFAHAENKCLFEPTTYKADLDADLVYDSDVRH